jgi:glycine cleavage system H lipoate-binding protein
MESLYKCIWMSAGVLNFRLCDREFDCERCQIDQAFRKGTPHPTGLASAAESVRSETATFRTSGRNFYHPCHLWVRIGLGGVVRVGLDAIASSLLKPLREVRLPLPGADVQQGQNAWTFIGDSGRCELPSPIAGKILSRNENLLLRPETIHEGSRREVWLARIRPSRLSEDLESLTYGRRVSEWLGSELEKIRGHLVRAHALSMGSIPDGGNISPSVLDGIDPSLRRALVEEMLLNPAQRQKGR